MPFSLHHTLSFLQHTMYNNDCLLFEATAKRSISMRSIYTYSRTAFVFFVLILSFSIMNGCSILLDEPAQAPEDPAHPERIPAFVERVVDGDTINITVEGKEETVRLLLIDTPETKHPTKPVQPFGPEASQYTKDHLEGKNIELELDVSERDKYGRLLAYVWINDQLFNEMLLAEGLARVAYVYPPNIKYVDQFREVQKIAQQEGIGIWSIEDYAREDGFAENVKMPREETVPASNSTATNKPEGDLDSHNSPIVIQEVNLREEYVILYNRSAEAILMEDWLLVSVQGDQRYTFPDDFSLAAGAQVTIWSGTAEKDATPSHLWWTSQNIWRNDGDAAQLYHGESLMDEVQ